MNIIALFFRVNSTRTLFRKRSTSIDFAKKPAITKFDKPFTPNRKFSEHFATYTGSIFSHIAYVYFVRIYSRLAHLVSGLFYLFKQIFQLFLICYINLSLIKLSLKNKISCIIIIQKVHLLYINIAQLLYNL